MVSTVDKKGPLTTYGLFTLNTTGDFVSTTGSSPTRYGAMESQLIPTGDIIGVAFKIFFNN
jgi:hypothetical protein